MSLLTATHEDFERRNGANLPAGVYRVTIESAGPKAYENGTQLDRMYGNIRTRDGATELAVNGGTFHIGNRKLFAHSWIDHKNPKAQRAGNAQIAREAAAAGLMQAPAKGETAELPFDNWEEYAAQLAGREVLVKVILQTRKSKQGPPELDDDGKPKVDAVVTDWMSA